MVDLIVILDWLLWWFKIRHVDCFSLLFCFYLMLLFFIMLYFWIYCCWQ